MCDFCPPSLMEEYKAWIKERDYYIPRIEADLQRRKKEADTMIRSLEIEIKKEERKKEDRIIASKIDKAVEIIGDKWW